MWLILSCITNTKQSRCCRGDQSVWLRITPFVHCSLWLRGRPSLFWDAWGCEKKWDVLRNLSSGFLVSASQPPKRMNAAEFLSGMHRILASSCLSQCRFGVQSPPALCVLFACRVDVISSQMELLRSVTADDALFALSFLFIVMVLCSTQFYS